VPPLTTLVAGVAGGTLGLAADRLAARWPAHPGGSVRRVDWRTFVVVLAGAGGALGIALRDPGPLAAAYIATLVVLLATDLDQRLLPDPLTLPWIAIALAAGVAGANPLVGAALPAAVAVALLVPGALLLLSIPFGTGAIGIGDLKLLASVGLLLGAERALLGLLAGVLAGGVTILALLLARRITLRSHVPYGPFLIVGAIWALLLPMAG
jgi:leader peptidase (prepilin peptidase)/N-methyltransferase